MPLLEIAAASIASALAAQEGGADRIELCANLREGGTTPSHGTLVEARKRLRIPIHVLVRARGGDFLYDEAEAAAMLGDVEDCVHSGADGVVIGALDADGDVAVGSCQAMIDAAEWLGVTFHRAFDLARDPHRALEDIVSLGCERILTSGQRESAPEGAALIRALVDQAAGRIVIMPGAGVDAGNIAAVRQKTGATEFHASAKRLIVSGMRHRPERLAAMQDGEMRSDGEEIRRMLKALA